MKKILSAVIAVCICFAITACNNNTNTQEETTQATTYTMQEGDTQVTGEVTQIVGNEVTLALGTVSADNTTSSDGEISSDGTSQRGNKQDFSGEMPDMSDGEAPDFDSEEMPDFDSGEAPDFDSGEMPDFDSSEMPDLSSGKNFGNRGSSIEKSGDTGTYTLPVGMTISGLSGRSSDYSAVSVGTILTLTINSDGNVVAAEAN